MRLGTVLVSGPSMEPALREGDCLLVRRDARVRAGDVVVGRLDGRPDLLVVKRATARDGDGWHLASDNAGAPGAVSGRGTAVAVVVLRWWPLPPRRVRRRA